MDEHTSTATRQCKASEKFRQARVASARVMTHAYCYFCFVLPLLVLSSSALGRNIDGGVASCLHDKSLGAASASNTPLTCTKWNEKWGEECFSREAVDLEIDIFACCYKVGPQTGLVDSSIAQPTFPGL